MTDILFQKSLRKSINEKIFFEKYESIDLD